MPELIGIQNIEPEQSGKFVNMDSVERKFLCYAKTICLFYPFHLSSEIFFAFSASFPNFILYKVQSPDSCMKYKIETNHD